MGHTCRAGYSTLMPRSDGPRTTHTDDRSRVLIVMGIALLIRLIYLVQSSRNPYFYTPVFDGQNYDLLARGILRSGLVDPQLFWQPVFYPLFLTVSYALTGSSIVAVKTLQIIIGTATCGLTCLLGRRIFDRRTGWVAGLIVALYGPTIFFETELLANAWAAFWCVAMVLILLQLADDAKPWRWLLLGLVCGLATLTRSTFLLSFIAGLAWLTWRLRDATRGLGSRPKYIVLAFIGFTLPTLPVAIESYLVTGRASIMAANGGINLYIGNNEHAAETEAAPPWEYVHVRALASQAGSAGIWGEDRYFSRLAWRFILGHPMATATNLVRKAGQFVCSREIPGYEDVYLQRRWSSLLGILVWKAGSFGFPYGLLLPLSILGAIIAARRVPAPVWIILAIEAGAMIFFHVVARYRTTSVPLLAILAAAGVVWLVNAVRARQPVRLSFAAGILVATILLATWPGPFKLERLNTESEMALSAGYYEQIQDRDGRRRYR